MRGDPLISKLAQFNCSMVYCVPSDRFHIELSSTGMLSALPYLAMAIVLQLAGHLADRLRTRNLMTTTNVRKSFNCGAFIAQVGYTPILTNIITVFSC